MVWCIFLNVSLPFFAWQKRWLLSLFHKSAPLNLCNWLEANKINLSISIRVFTRMQTHNKSLKSHNLFFQDINTHPSWVIIPISMSLHWTPQVCMSILVLDTCFLISNFNIWDFPSMQWSQKSNSSNLSPFSRFCFPNSTKPLSLMCPNLRCHNFALSCIVWLAINTRTIIAELSKLWRSFFFHPFSNCRHSL